MSRMTPACIACLHQPQILVPKSFWRIKGEGELGNCGNGEIEWEGHTAFSDRCAQCTNIIVETAKVDVAARVSFAARDILPSPFERS